MKGTQELAQLLLSRIYTTNTLKQVSQALEKVSQNKGFKIHASEIIADGTLTDNQKRTQLLYLVKSIDIPVLYDFFSDQLANNSFWLFSSGQIDYFDAFVREFQQATEGLEIVKFSTAIPLEAADVKAISDNLSKWLGSHVIIQPEVNSAMIGGAQIQIENLVFDYSLRSKFRHFTKEWLRSISTTQASIGFHDDAL